MKAKLAGIVLVVVALLSIAMTSFAGDICRLKMYFGLSLPNGGAVSLEEWEMFEKEHFAKAFDGFTVVDAKGYYKGKSEHTKVVTLIVEEKDIPKARELGKRYAKLFGQEAVMLVKIPVEEWSFIGAD